MLTKDNAPDPVRVIDPNQMVDRPLRLFADDVPVEATNTYEPVTCLACTRVHLVNRSTGETLYEGEDK